MFPFSPWQTTTCKIDERRRRHRNNRRRRLHDGERLESRYALAMVQGGFGWAATFDTVQTTIPHQDYEIESSAIDQDGHLYVAGSFTGQIDVDPSSETTALIGDTVTFNDETHYAWNPFIVKYSPTGDVVWAKKFESDGEGANSIKLAISPTGDVILAGHLLHPFDADPGPGTTTISHIDPAATSSQSIDNDAFVISLSGDGQFKWAIRYGRSGSEEGLVEDLIVDTNGGIYVAGQFSGTMMMGGASGSSSSILSSAGGLPNGYVLKLGSNGGLQWARVFESDGSSDARFLAQDGSGGIYVAGSFEGSVDINPGSPISASFRDEPGLGSYLARLDAAGNFTGGAGFPGLNANGVTGFHVDAASNIYVSGFVSGTYPVADILGPSAGDVVFNTSSMDDYDAFVLKLLPSGQVAWAKQFGSSIGGDYADCITTDPFGNVIVGGSFTGTVDFDPGPGIQQVASSTVNDAFLLWLDRDGAFISVRAFAGSGEEETIESVLVDDQGNTFIRGIFRSPIDMDPGDGEALLVDPWAAYILSEVGEDGFYESQFFSKQATVAAIGQSIGGVQVGVGPGGYVIRDNGALIPVTYGGRMASPTSPGGGWAIVGGRSNGSGYETLWRSAAGGYGAWVLDANGALVSSRALSLTDVLTLETSLGTDLTGDGKSGMAFTAASPAVAGVVFGSTPQGYAVRVGNNPPIQVTFGGQYASANNPGSGWRAVGAQASQGGGFEVLWAGPGNSFGAWQLDASGRQRSASALTATAILELEEELEQDINGDGEVGLPFTPQGSPFGSVQFGATPLGYALQPNSGSPIQVTFGGRNASASVPGSGWEAIGGRAAGGGYEVLWSGPGGLFGAWSLDALGRQTGARLISQGELHTLESAGGIDIDGDGRIGPVFSPNGRLWGNVQFGNVPSGYALQVGSGQPIPISFGGRSASASNPGAGWEAFAARTSSANRYEVLWRGPTNQVGSWIVDASGKQLSAKLFTPSELAQLEESLDDDLDRNGTIGQPTTDGFVPLRSNGVFGTNSSGYAFRNNQSAPVRPVTFAGGQASASNPGTGWQAIHGRVANGSPEVIWRGPGNVFGKWVLHPTEYRLSSSSVLSQGDVLDLEKQESVDLNGDGEIGSPFNAIGPVTGGTPATGGWATQAGASGAVEINSVSTSNLADGSAIITGTFRGTATFGATQLTSDGPSSNMFLTDVFIAKLNADGSWAWATRAGGSEWDGGTGISTLGDGSSIITGYFEGTATFGTTQLTSAGSVDVFIAKLNADGSWAWVTRAGSRNFDSGAGISTLADGSALITGRFSGTATFGTTQLIWSGREDVFVAKLNADGSWAWAARAGGWDSDWGSGISMLADGSAIMAGSFSGTATFGTTQLSSAGSVDVFIAKLNADGSWAWATRAGGSEWDGVTDISTLADGSSIITGSFEGSATFGTTQLSSAGSVDVFIAKLNADGSWAWATRAGGSSDDGGMGISTLADGSAIMAGSFRGTATFGTTQLTSAGSADVFIAKLNADGNWRWVTRAGGNDSDWGSGISTLADGSAIMAGSFRGTPTFGTTQLTSTGSEDIFIAKLNADGSLDTIPATDSVQLGVTPLGYAVQRNDAEPLQVTIGAGEYASATTPGGGWVGDRAWANGSGYQMLWKNVNSGLYGLWELNAYGRQTSVKLLSQAAVNRLLDGSFDDVIGGVEAAPSALPAPKGVTVTARDAAINVAWSAVAASDVAVRGYVVEVGGDSSFRNATRYTVTVPTLTVQNLANGQTYFVRVATLAEQGLGEFSSVASVTLNTTPIPLPPQSLTVSAGDRSLVVQWSAPANYSTGNGGLTYVVEYSTTSSFSSPFSVGAGNRLTATLSGLSNNTTYYVRVVARSAGGLGQFSTTATGMPRSLASPPSAPISVRTESRDSSVLVSWSPPSNTGNASITSYRVQFESGSDSRVQTTTSTSLVVTGLTNGNVYRFSVAAVNSAGIGTYSNSVAETPRAPVTVPGAPSTPWTFYGATPSGADVSVLWPRPSADGNSPIRQYEIQVATNSSFSQNVKAYSIIPDRDGSGIFKRLLSLNQTYHFRVRARNDVGWGAWSGTLSHLYQSDPNIAAPNAVQNVQIQSSPRTIQFSWQPSSTGAAATYYTIEVREYHPSTNTLIAAQPFLNGSNPRWYVTSAKATLTRDTPNRIQFLIVAHNQYGKSAAVATQVVSVPPSCSAMAIAIGACGPTTAPSSLVNQNVGDGTLRVGWSPIQNAQQYELEVYNNSTNRSEGRARTADNRASDTIKQLVPGQSYRFRVRAIYRNGSTSSWSNWSAPATVSVTQSAPVQGDLWYAGVWEVRHRATGSFGDIEEGYVKVNVRRLSDDGFFTTVEVTVTTEPSRSRFPNQLFKFPDTYRGTAAFRDRIPNSLLRDGVFDVLVDRSDNYITPTLERQDPSDGQWTPVFRTAFDAFNIRIERNGRDSFGGWGNPTRLEFVKTANASF